MSAQTHKGNTPALTVLGSLFFMLGFITCMNDILTFERNFQPDLCAGDVDSILFLQRVCHYVDSDGSFC